MMSQALTPEGVGDGLRLEAGHQALAGLHQQLECRTAQHRALRARRARWLQLGQAMQRCGYIHLVKHLHPLPDLLQHLWRSNSASERLTCSTTIFSK